MAILDNELLKKLEAKYESNLNNKIIENAIFKNGIKASSTNNQVVRKHDFQFSVEVKPGSITNQKHSGRCWIFAELNAARAKVMKDLNIEDLEFSQNFIHFYDKLEKANAYLTWIATTGLELDNEDRLFRRYNENPISDGGYFEFFLNIASKYGIVPKSAMPESFHSEATNDMVEQINWRLKAYTFRMREAYKKNHNMSEVEAIQQHALEDVYNILVKSLGMPPKTFIFEYYDKDKKFVRLPKMTPIKFFETYIKQFVENKVDVISDPREIYPYYRQLVAPSVFNSVGGIEYKMLNIPMNELKAAAIKQLQSGQSIWFGCDVTTFYSKEGIFDTKLYDYDLTLTETPKEFNKKEKFESRASVISHAMNLIGVNLDEKGNPINWKVENSWGTEVGKKGYWSMSDSWFEEYVYMLIVDKEFLSKEAIEGLSKEAIEISPYDPLCEE